jgi:hypothetical protein
MLTLCISPLKLWVRFFQHGEVYSIQPYVITDILLKMVLNAHNPNPKPKVEFLFVDYMSQEGHHSGAKSNVRPGGGKLII